MKIRKFRMMQILVSTSVFFIIFLYFLFTTRFKITNIQLSYWGSKEKHSWLWNGSIILLSISMMINIYDYINSYTKLFFKSQLILLFASLNFSLFMVGLINMNYHIHDILAVYYFFGYPLAIFLFAHFNYKNMSVKVWRTNLVYSIILVILPLSVIRIFDGMAISETIHSILMISWNYWILKFGNIRHIH